MLAKTRHQLVRSLLQKRIMQTARDFGMPLEKPPKLFLYSKRGTKTAEAQIDRETRKAVRMGKKIGVSREVAEQGKRFFETRGERQKRDITTANLGSSVGPASKKTGRYPVKISSPLFSITISGITAEATHIAVQEYFKRKGLKEPSHFTEEFFDVAEQYRFQLKKGNNTEKKNCEEFARECFEAMKKKGPEKAPSMMHIIGGALLHLAIKSGKANNPKDILALEKQALKALETPSKNFMEEYFKIKNLIG